jgi:hypothetical protein
VVNRKTIAPTLALANAFSLTVDPSGVVLGRDSTAAPVLVRLFGPEPTSVAFVGGWWAAQILTYRCLAHGATVVIDALDTTTPSQHGAMANLSQWLALDRTAGGSQGRVRPMFGGPMPIWPSSAVQPLLRLYDAGPGGPARRPRLSAWQAQLTVLTQVTPASLPVLAGADIVLAQRLGRPDAGLVGSALLLGPEFVARFEAMDNEMVAAFRGPAVRYAWLNPTTLERQLFG